MTNLVIWITVRLMSPICVDPVAAGRVMISRVFGVHWRLIGFGTIQGGDVLQLHPVDS